jgi:hypothetical protein
MAKSAAAPAKLPPPTARKCWVEFLKWVVGLPLLVVGALGFVWLAYRLTGSFGMSWQLESNTATVLFWLAAISLMYPVMLFVWWSDLRDGLKRARDWEAMTPEARAAAIVEAEAAALVAKPKRRSRKKA